MRSFLVLARLNPLCACMVSLLAACAVLSTLDMCGLIESAVV